MHLLSYDPITGYFSWNVDRQPNIKAGDRAGSLEVQGYIVIMIDGCTYKAHRLAWLFVRKRWPPKDTDHKNRVRHENQISNLRKANRSQNATNSKTRIDNSSGVRGVSLCLNRYKKWKVQVNKGSQRISKCFYSKAEAAQFYKEASKKVFGEFAS